MSQSQIHNLQKSNIPKGQLVLISVGLTLLILAAFEPIRHNGFIDYDDNIYITENPHIQSGFTRQSIQWAFTSGHAANWHPLTWLSHMLDIELFGLNPLGHHLHNLVLHITATLLLFIVLYQMTGAAWCSAFVAMVFGIHPLRVESVAWAAERKDVLCALFWMLTLLAYVYYTRQESLGRYLLVILCFALGLMAKPMIVTLPLILILLDFWPLRRTSQKRLRVILEKIPLIILTFISCIITYEVQRQGRTVEDNTLVAHHLTNAIVSYVGYLGKIIWPQKLAVFYPYPVHGWPLWRTAVDAALFVVFNSAVIYRFFKQPSLAAGWLWYLISLIPVIGLVQVGAQAMADRYTYLPSIGITVLIFWGIAQWSARWRYRKILIGLLGGSMAIAMITGTRIQLSYWKDSIALFEHTLAVTRDNYIMHRSLGLALNRENRTDEAAEQFLKAIEIQPDDPYSNMNMAILYIQRNQYDEALICNRKSLESESDDATVYYNAGVIFEVLEKFPESVNAYRQAVRLDENNVDALNKLAWILAVTSDAQLRNPNQAIHLAQRMCRLTDFSEPVYLDTLAAAYAANGQFEESVENAQKAVDIASAAGKTELALDIKKRLLLYQSRKPYLMTPSPK